MHGGRIVGCETVFDRLLFEGEIVGFAAAEFAGVGI